MSIVKPRNRVEAWLYRALMRVAHRFHWHYAPPLYPDGDTELWCQWCGFRAIVKHADQYDLISVIPRKPAGDSRTEGKR